MPKAKTKLQLVVEQAVASAMAMRPLPDANLAGRIYSLERKVQQFSKDGAFERGIRWERGRVAAILRLALTEAEQEKYQSVFDALFPLDSATEP